MCSDHHVGHKRKCPDASIIASSLQLSLCLPDFACFLSPSHSESVAAVLFILIQQQSENRSGTFLASGHLPSQRSVLLLHAGAELVLVPRQCVLGRTGDKMDEGETLELLRKDL